MAALLFRLTFRKKLYLYKTANLWKYVRSGAEVKEIGSLNVLNFTYLIKYGNHALCQSVCAITTFQTFRWNVNFSLLRHYVTIRHYTVRQQLLVTWRLLPRIFKDEVIMDCMNVWDIHEQ